MRVWAKRMWVEEHTARKMYTYICTRLSLGTAQNNTRGRRCVKPNTHLCTLVKQAVRDRHA